MHNIQQNLLNVKSHFPHISPSSAASKAQECADMFANLATTKSGLINDTMSCLNQTTLFATAGIQALSTLHRRTVFSDPITAKELAIFANFTARSKAQLEAIIILFDNTLIDPLDRAARGVNNLIDERTALETSLRADAVVEANRRGVNKLFYNVFASFFRTSSPPTPQEQALDNLAPVAQLLDAIVVQLNSEIDYAYEYRDTLVALRRSMHEWMLAAEGRVSQCQYMSEKSRGGGWFGKGGAGRGKGIEVGGVHVEVRWDGEAGAGAGAGEEVGASEDEAATTGETEGQIEVSTDDDSEPLWTALASERATLTESLRSLCKEEEKEGEDVTEPTAKGKATTTSGTGSSSTSGSDSSNGNESHSHHSMNLAAVIQMIWMRDLVVLFLE